jgi:hypothetical protein
VSASAGSTSPAWTTRLIEDLDASDQRATALARGLTAEQLNWRPSVASWSIGQCLQHLLVTNEVYLSPMASALAGQTHSPIQEITPGWFGRWFIRNYIEPSPATKHAKAPQKIAPAQHIEPAVIDKFVRSNEQVRDLIRRASAYDVNRVRFKNPFIPLLRFTVGTGLLIITTHERRHLLQAERVRHAAGFPAK